MSPGAKIFLTLAGVGAVIGVIAVAAAPAHAAPGQPKQPKPGDKTPPDVVVPEAGQSAGGDQPLPQPGGGAAPIPAGGGGLTVPGTNIPLNPFQPPPGAQPQAQPPGVPPGTTFSLPNPLGGPPLGTFNPATGNVIGPNAVIIGTFNPATGIFTGPAGSFQVPGFGPTPSVGPAPAPPSATPAPSPPGVTVQTPTGPVTIPLPAPVAAPTATAPVSTVSADTAALVQELLAAETQSGWNRVDPQLRTWQRTRPPLVADGELGPKSNLMIAKEIGTLPLIRYWPKGSNKATALAAYQDALEQLASSSSDPVHAQQLRLSAQREQAQAFSTKGPLPPVPANSQVQISQVA